MISALREFNVFDLSPIFETNMPGSPDHPSMGIVDDARNFEQNGYAAQTLVMSEHTGSHVDAPAHAIRDMRESTIDKYPADQLIGVYKKYDLKDDFKAGQYVGFDVIKEIEKKTGIKPRPQDIILLDFGWDKYYYSKAKHSAHKTWWGKNAPGLGEEVCRYFSDVPIRAIGSDTVGCDAPVVDGVFKTSFGHAKYFLPRHILIMEGLRNLGQIPKTGIFMALPLKIKQGSGSPIRPIALGL
jgi:kynurenine formamidase